MVARSLRHCGLCTQTELIVALLREDAAKAERLVDLPPAGMVWRRAQARRRERALQRAARRPFLIVGALGTIYSVVLLLWGIFQIPQSVYRLVYRVSRINRARGTHRRSTGSNTSHCGIVCIGT